MAQPTGTIDDGLLKAIADSIARTTPAQAAQASDRLKVSTLDIKKYNEDQGRDDHGRFGSGGGKDAAVKLHREALQAHEQASAAQSQAGRSVGMSAYKDRAAKANALTAVAAEKTAAALKASPGENAQRAAGHSDLAQEESHSAMVRDGAPSYAHNLAAHAHDAAARMHGGAISLITGGRNR